ncbi:hypothetical protein PsYK624_137260 [Phanerochaete sordida]|uniref:Uncharacterized protein n=1 Tax=Phanerochaete sordida TaxID=48140 RepID=A0A9P3GLH6_9APHY|nr:hypothetical protein PsYK624_137260 [Phanerochaete sordida]
MREHARRGQTSRKSCCRVILRPGLPAPPRVEEHQRWAVVTRNPALISDRPRTVRQPAAELTQGPQAPFSNETRRSYEP